MINRKPVEVPPGICLACFNEQEQFAFPFFVYCPHRAELALVHGRSDHTTFACKPSELKGMIREIERGALSAQSPGR